MNTNKNFNYNYAFVFYDVNEKRVAKVFKICKNILCIIRSPYLEAI